MKHRYPTGAAAKAIGNTPLVEIVRITQPVRPVRVLAKTEWNNPGGSVKDRAALAMVRAGLESSELSANRSLLDASSGNTGIAYAMLGAAMGFHVKLCVPGNIGATRRRVLEAYGAELTITNPVEGSDGAIREAIRLHAEHPDRYYYPDQYSNPANVEAHYRGTGVEIFGQTEGQVTHFVAGLGTTGTFMGAGRRLREFRPDIRLISFQPKSPFHGLEGLKHMPSALVPALYDPGLADENLWIETERAQEMVKRLAREEGLLVGLSSGAAMACALDVAKELKHGLVVTVFPDSGDRYLDQTFWQNSTSPD